MKIAKIKTNGVQIKEIEKNLHSYIEKVEYDGKMSHRIVLKGLNTPAFLIKKDDEYRGVHYCEANEKGATCKHLSIIATVAQLLDGNAEKFSIKTTVKEFKDFEDQFKKHSFTNINHEFGLIVPIEENGSVTATTSTSISVPAAAATSISVSSKRDWKIEWNTIQTFLDEQGVSPALIAKVQQKREKVFKTVFCLSTMIEPVKPNYPYQGEMLPRAIRHVLLGKHLILLGGKGSGKDTLISTLSWIFGLPMTIQVGSKDETKESIVGEPAFRNGESTFDLSPLANTVKDGGLVNMAEVNMLSGDVTSVYHSLFDENGVLATPVGAINHHEQFLMIATMNVGEGYSGVRPLNDAFKDRFAMLRLPYVADFKTMLSQKTGLHDTAGLSFLEKIRNAVEKLIREESQGHSANTIRGYVDAARYFLMVGITHETKTEVIEDYIINKAEDTDEYMALRDMIRQEGWRDFPISPEEDQYMKGEY